MKEKPMNVRDLSQEKIAKTKHEHCQAKDCWGLWVPDGQEWSCWLNCPAFERAAEKQAGKEQR